MVSPDWMLPEKGPHTVSPDRSLRARTLKSSALPLSIRSSVYTQWEKECKYIRVTIKGRSVGFLVIGIRDYPLKNNKKIIRLSARILISMFSYLKG